MGIAQRTPGIYMITCLSNKKVYIGSTLRLNRRRNNHYDSLRRQIHSSKALQGDYNRYGESAVIFSVLERVDSCVEESTLRAREGVWLARFNATDHRYGYNIQDPVTQKDIIYEGSNRRHSHKICNEQVYLNSSKFLPFFMVNMATGHLELFTSTRIFERVHGIPVTIVTDCLRYWDTTLPLNKRGGTRSYKGFLFIHAGLYDSNFNYRSYNKIHRKEILEKIPVPMAERDLGRKELIMTSIATGATTVYRSAKDCMLQNGFKRNKVYDVLAGIGKSHRGYTFSYTGVCDRL